MRYPIAIESGDDRHAYGIVVPDLPGCFSAGDTLDEAITNAEDAILLHLEAGLAENQAPPEPSSLEKLAKRKEYRGWTWAIVEADLAKIGGKSERVNVSFPTRLLTAIDDYAEKKGETRSGFLARAALVEMQRNPP